MGNGGSERFRGDSETRDSGLTLTPLTTSPTVCGLG